jgi:hypothetical protein
MLIQQWVWFALVAFAVGQTSNAPRNITSYPGYATLSDCAHCALQLPGSSINQCPPGSDSVIQSPVGCNSEINWACACTQPNLRNALSRIAFLSCEDQSNITSVLQDFCNSISEGDFASTTVSPTPSTAAATQPPTPVNISPPSQQTTASTDTPDSGNAGSFTSS